MMLADENRLEKLRLAVEAKYKSKARQDEPIARLVAAFYGLSIDEIMARDRPKDIYWARAVSYYLMKRNGNPSLRKIANRMGGKCSSKVHYALKTVSDRIAKDPQAAKQIAELEKKLREL